MRRSTLLTAAVAALSVAFALLSGGVPPAADEAVAAPGDGRRPNVLLITADDMRADDLRFMRFTRGEFRRRAVTFTDAVSPYPLCCPARAQIVTGQYNHNNGVRGNAWPNGGHWALRSRANTLPVWLARQGYRTAFVGKYMNEYGSPPGALHDPRGLLDGRRRYEVPPGWTHWYGAVGGVYDYASVTVNADGPGGPPRRRHVSRYQTDYYGDLTTSLIRRYHRERRPFFIWASHLAPHTTVRDGRWLPPVPHVRDRGAYRNASLPRTFAAAFNAPAGNLAPSRPVTRARALQLHRARAASLRSLDRAVRAAVTTLRRTGEYGRTTIVFTSDNGFMLGEQRSLGKDLPYEAALRVPMIVNAPGLRTRYRPGAGARERVTVPHTVSITDIASTVVGVTGVRAGRRLDGLDMTRPAANPDHRPGGDRVVLIESGARGRRLHDGSRFVGVRTDGWTWFAWRFDPDGGPGGTVTHGAQELYDRRADAAQTRNLIGPSAQRTLLSRLARDMHDCRGRDCVRALS